MWSSAFLITTPTRPTRRRRRHVGCPCLQSRFSLRKVPRRVAFHCRCPARVRAVAIVAQVVAHTHESSQGCNLEVEFVESQIWAISPKLLYGLVLLY